MNNLDGATTNDQTAISTDQKMGNHNTLGTMPNHATVHSCRALKRFKRTEEWQANIGTAPFGASGDARAGTRCNSRSPAKRGPEGPAAGTALRAIGPRRRVGRRRGRLGGTAHRSPSTKPLHPHPWQGLEVVCGGCLTWGVREGV